MKKLVYSMLAMAMTAMTFISCEDVPMPYNNPNDYQEKEKDLPEGTYMEESFSNGFGSFSVLTTKGTPWTINYSTATASGYNSSDKTNTESESYLVSPEIDLSQAKKAYIIFDYIFRYANNDGENKVLITDQYNEDPTTTDWEDITGDLTEGSDWNTFSTYSRQIDEKFIGKKIRIALYYNASDKSSRTWEVKNLAVREGDAPQADDSDEPITPTEGTGSGTKEDPYNVQAALSVIQAVGEKGTPNEVYVKGVISKIDEIDTNFGNATYYITDKDGNASELYVFHGAGLGNEKMNKQDYIKVGDEVTVFGKLVNFKGNTPEMTQGNYLYSLNGQEKSAPDDQDIEGESKGDGTKASPYNVPAALRLIKTLGTKESDEVYVEGIISKIDDVETKEFGNATFYISEDGGTNNQLEIFRCLYLQSEKFTSPSQIKTGDKVVVYGKLVNFKGNTPEMTQGGYIYSLNGETTPKAPERDKVDAEAPGIPNQMGIDVNIDDFGITSSCYVGTLTITSTGTKITFSKGEGNDDVKYMNSGCYIRLNPGDSMIIDAGSETIYGAMIMCLTSGQTAYNAGGEVEVSSGRVSYQSDIYINSCNSNKLIITNRSTATGAKGQLRITGLSLSMDPPIIN